jgi:hypothetical protein
LLLITGDPYIYREVAIKRRTRSCPICDPLRRLRVLTVPAALLVFLTLPSLSPSSTSATGHLCACSPPTTTTASHPPVTTSPADVSWLKAQLAANSLHLADGSHDAWHRLRKGINPRTRDQQLFDINRYRKHEHL